MNRIRDLREDHDLKQTELAKMVGIDQRTLSNYETGKTNPDSEAILRLADYFGVSCDYLLGRERPVKTDKLLEQIDKMQKQLEKMKTTIQRL